MGHFYASNYLLYGNPFYNSRRNATTLARARVASTQPPRPADTPAQLPSARLRAHACQIPCQIPYQIPVTNPRYVDRSTQTDATTTTAAATTYANNPVPGPEELVQRMRPGVVVIQAFDEAGVRVIEDMYVSEGKKARERTADQCTRCAIKRKLGVSKVAGKVSRWFGKST